MGKPVKTNAMRLLDKDNIDYKVHLYDVSDMEIDGISVALKTGNSFDKVYKTLIVQGTTKEYYVCVIPVDKELDLKKMAVACKEKKVDLIPVKNLLSLTGYIKGGCSPIGMKKQFNTFFHEDINNIDSIIVSGGKIGTQIELDSKNLVQVTKGRILDITK